MLSHFTRVAISFIPPITARIGHTLQGIFLFILSRIMKWRLNIFHFLSRLLLISIYFSAPKAVKGKLGSLEWQKTVPGRGHFLLSHKEKERKRKRRTARSGSCKSTTYSSGVAREPFDWQLTPGDIQYGTSILCSLCCCLPKALHLLRRHDSSCFTCNYLWTLAHRRWMGKWRQTLPQSPTTKKWNNHSQLEGQSSKDKPSNTKHILFLA